MTETDIRALEDEIRHLRQTLEKKEAFLKQLKDGHTKMINNLALIDNIFCPIGLSKEDITRYSRQMLIPEIGAKGQKALKNSKVLIVGVGGLGCPAAIYLTGAGIGEITLVDYDEVEISNLHRQVLHCENFIGISKVQSAYDTLHRINSSIKIIPLKVHATSSSITKIIEEGQFTVVIDGTDNVATRYLLNDICVLNKIPLVSGSALQMEGQLTVYNYKGGPCYRCLFPVPPPPESVKSCGDGGVLGPIPGTIGVLQALETIKIITNMEGVMSERLLIFDGSSCTFRNFKLRKRNVKCEVCGDQPIIKELIDYEQFCRAGAHDKVANIDILKKTETVTVSEFQRNAISEFQRNASTNKIVDVRSEIEFNICHLPNSINIPLSYIEKNDTVEIFRETFQRNVYSLHPDKVYVICRRGNDSQRAIVLLKEKLVDLNYTFINIKGGLHAYSKHICNDFPIY